MPSTYNNALRLEEIANGEQSGQWGTTTNKNLGTLLVQAIAGTTTLDVTAGNITLTALDGLTDQSRSAVLAVTGTPGVTRVLTIPNVTKLYTVRNVTVNIVQVKTASGTAFDCPPSAITIIVCDGANGVQGSSVAPLNSPTFTGNSTGVRNFGTSAYSFGAKALGTAQGQLAGYSLFPTFQGTVDNVARRAADIWSGFNGGTWATAYLSFGVVSSINDVEDITPERMRITASGNVGIGTIAPAQRLSVSSGTNNDGILITNTSTANTTAKTARVGFVGTDISGTIKEAANIYIVPDDVNYVGARMSFYTRGSDTVAEHMTIASSGNVGIGTVVPVAKLDVIGAGSNGTIRAAHPGNTSFGVVILAETTAGTDDPAIVIKNYNGGSPVSYGLVCKDNGSLAFNSGITPTGGFGTERVRIDSSGNVGVGTASPTRKLDVVGTGAFTTSVDGTTLTVSGGGVDGQAGQILQTNTYAGVPTPNKYLRVDGSGQWQIVNSAYSATCMSLTDAGAANQGNNSSTWTVVSDARIKQNIRPITGALDKICSLNPVHFEYKTRPNKIKTNFIAQEFEQVFPGHVVESAPGMEFESLFAAGEKMKSIDVDMIPYLVKAIQELKAEIDLLKGI